MPDIAGFIERHVREVAPLEKEGSVAYWNAAVSGSSEDWDRYSSTRLALEKIYTDKASFELLREARETGGFEDPQSERMVEILYLRYLGNQADPRLLERIVELSSSIENRFSVFRAEAGGVRMTMNEVLDVLRGSGDAQYRRAVWEASKEAGAIVSEDLLDLVRLRNETARSAGFENYHAMSLFLGEQDAGAMSALFDELDGLTGEPFRLLKGRIDDDLARRFGVSAGDIRPWHYSDPFFQESPAGEVPELDGYFDGTDVVEIAARFYESIGMPVADIIERSDLYEKEGKNPHAFCADIDRDGDIRILANVRGNVNWMETMLHELGHAVYDKYIRKDLPWLLRTYPHLAVTEASAMFFGRLTHDPGWIAAALGLGGGEVAKIEGRLVRAQRAKQLVFSRWTQVMFRFERALYEDPDRDLDSLWWDLVERYQLVRRPEGRSGPDWAAKIHIVSNPVYYHNYMLGEMIASQLHRRIKAVLSAGRESSGIYGDLAAGDFFRERVYGPGCSQTWTRHIESVTGEPLRASYFAEQFVEGGN